MIFLQKWYLKYNNFLLPILQLNNVSAWGENMATTSLVFFIYSIRIMLCTGHENFVGTYDEINFSLKSPENLV